MASFTIEINNKYGVSTYKQTKETYEWINKAISQLDLGCEKIGMDVLFNIGQIRCSCKSLEEFIENAYSQENYKFISMTISQINTPQQIFFIVSSNNKISISTNSKTNLEKMVEILNQTDPEDKESTKTINNIENQNIYNNAINGDNNNVIQGNGNTIEVMNKAEEKPKSKLKEWINSILQNLIASWIWWLLGAIGIGSIILYYFNKFFNN